MKNLRKTFSIMMMAVLIQGLLSLNNVYSQSKSYQQNVIPEEIKERLEDIYQDNEFSVNTFRGSWLPDGSGYLVFEDKPGSDVRTLVRYDIDGNRSELISPDMSGFPAGSSIESYTLSNDGDKILLRLSSNGEENNERGYWIFDRKTTSLKKVKAGGNSSISPDGKHILYSDGGDLYVYDLTDEETTQLTNNANDEAVSNSRGEWSPDGQSILFVQSDGSDIKIRSSLIPVDPTYPAVNEQRFARVGGDISVLRVGVVDIEGNEIRWLPISIPKEGYYLGEVSWAGNSDEVLVEKRSRFRDSREFLIANVNDGKITNIYEESDPAWVVASYNKNGGVNWIDDYRSFLILTEKDGWRHAYVNSREGKKEILLTPGDYDVIDRVGMDEDKKWFYYYASPDNGTQRYLYRVRVDGKGKPERITPSDQPGTHSYDLSPDGKWAFHTWSSANTPPVTELVSLPEHKVQRVLVENNDLKEKIKTLGAGPKEFLTIDIGNGIVMDAWMIKPADFDPSGKYPVFVYVYGEPHGQTVMDSWGHASADYHRVIASMGYLVISIDNRGTPAPKGAAWRRAIAGSLGPLSTEEQAEALLELARNHSYVDTSRVGIWGWSGGGSNTLNAMFRKPEVYDVGIAVAPKPQPHLYNAWFQEIYMNTPEVNPEGYRKSAPINFSEGLEGDLLIIHGTGETNTHIQITEGLVDRLVAQGKQFDYMTYPHRDHGLREGEGTSLHLRILMARYLRTHLPPGPQ